MKKILMSFVFLIILVGSAYADRITCKDPRTNKKYTVLFNSNHIKAFGKTFEINHVYSNTIDGSYTKLKKTLLGGQKTDEYWSFKLSLDRFSRLAKHKYIDGVFTLVFERYYSCNQDIQ